MSSGWSMNFRHDRGNQSPPKSAESEPCPDRGGRARSAQHARGGAQSGRQPPGAVSPFRRPRGDPCRHRHRRLRHAPAGAWSRSLGQARRFTKAALEAVAKTYVDFALRHPGIFPGDVSLRRGADRELSRGARQCRRRVRWLVQAIDDAFAGEPPEARRNLAIACWAFTHGLATLLLDGPLARRAGYPKGRGRASSPTKVIRTLAFWSEPRIRSAARVIQAH